VQRAPGFVAKIFVATCQKAILGVDVFWEGFGGGTSPVAPERIKTPDRANLARNEMVMLQATHQFDTPGVYRPLVRVEGPYAHVLYALPSISITGGPVRADSSIITAPRKRRGVV
jgi:hypothetical protein